MKRGFLNNDKKQMEVKNRVFSVMVGEESCSVSFPPTTAIQETFPIIENMVMDATNKKVAIKQLKSGRRILMKTATVGELVMQGEELTAVIDTPQAVAAPAQPQPQPEPIIQYVYVESSSSSSGGC